MLDPWIIEEIRRREQEEAQRQAEQPVLEIGDQAYYAPSSNQEGQGDGADRREGDRGERGVAVIDFAVR